MIQKEEIQKAYEIVNDDLRKALNILKKLNIDSPEDIANFDKAIQSQYQCGYVFYKAGKKYWKKADAFLRASVDMSYELYAEDYVDAFGYLYEINRDNKDDEDFMNLCKSKYVILGYYYGQFEKEDDNYKRDIMNLLMSLVKKYKPAILFLGECLEHGIGMEKNPKKALECYEGVATGDNLLPQALFFLGCLYFTGADGVKKDLQKARRYFKKAAENNYRTSESEEYLDEIDHEMNRDFLNGIHSEINQVKQGVNTLRKKMQDVSESIIGIQGSISTLKDDIRTIKASTKDIDDKCSEIFNSFNAAFDESKYSGRITEKVIRNTQRYLVGYFGGDLWNELSDYSKKSLTSALVFMDIVRELEDNEVDYSGAVIAGATALEHELEIRFFVSLQNFLTHRKIKKSRMPEGLRQGYFTLGSVGYIFNDFNDKGFYKHNPESVEAFDDYLDSIFKVRRPMEMRPHDFICPYVKRWQDFNYSFRIQAAHNDPVDRKTAIQALKILIEYSEQTAEAEYEQDIYSDEIGLLKQLLSFFEKPLPPEYGDTK